MKKTKWYLWLLVLTITTHQIKAQSSLGNPINIFDQYGHSYTLDQLQILSSGTSPVYGGKAAPVTSCQAGYFNIYYAPNCGMDGSTQADLDRRAVVCQVFYDISQFINSPLTGTNTCNILIETMSVAINNPSSSGVLGVNSPYYAEFFNPANATAGLIPGEVWKTIKNGKSSYINTAPFSNYPAYYSTSGYHGYLAFNFANSGINWDVSLNTNTITATQFDFYTNVLHEAMHMLGLASYISSNGSSNFGFNKSYYSYYDAFLTNYSGTSLITNGANSCTKYYHNFSAAASQSNLASCVGCVSSCSASYIPDNTNCSIANKFAGSTYTVPLYTPACFEAGASLSHFEDMCPTSSQNNLYYVMTNGVAVGSGSKKRYPKPEERAALCDIGYNVNGVYSTTVNGGNFSYSVSACPGKDIAGINDGLNSANTVTLICAANGSIQVNGINSNDRNATGGYDCLEPLLPSAGNLSNSSGSFNQSFTYTPTSGSGLHVLRYLPKNSSGQQGNITYIFIYVTPVYTCSNSCNKVYGGNLEGGTTPPADQFIKLSCGWEDANGGTCDYFSTNATSSVPSVLIPCNFHGYEPVAASTGTAYAGLICYYQPIASQSNNEAMFSKLTTPLAPNTAYKLTFDVSNAEERSSEGYSLQAYFSPDLSFLSNNSWNVNITNPSMLFTTPYTFTVMNGWQQAVFNFTTGSTTNNEQYLVIGNLQNNPGVSKSAGPSSVGSCVFGSSPFGAYYYIDNVTLTSNSVTATFNLPTGACTTQSIGLNALVSPSGGTFSGPYVTNSAGNWVFNASSTATVGSYAVAYNYTVSGCAYTIFKQIQVGPPHTVSASSNTNIICTNLSQSSATLTANSTTTGVTYLWQPVSSTINPVVVSPTASTVYTVTGYNQGCPSSATVAVNVQTSCCTTTLTPYSGNPNITTTNFATPLAFNYDINIGASQFVYFKIAEFQFAPNVKITVKNGGQLNIIGTHMYGCSDMWQGIVVEDGGQIKIFSDQTQAPLDNLIEDAVVAVDFQNQATTTYSTYGSLAQIKNVIFNRNRTAISIDNFVRNYMPYPFEIHSNIFTSRSLTFTPTSWPTCSITAGSLRAATNPTAGLQVPYLIGSFAPANLKLPYNTQPGHLGVKLNSVGSSTGTVQYAIQIGNTASTANYNIFDGLGQCIEATTSNLLSLNNVFQNTQQYWVYPPPPFSPYFYGGAAIRHITTSLFTSRLELGPNGVNTPTLANFGNRFYDCHTALDCDNAHILWVTYATFRSSNTSSTAPTGSVGIVDRTNRFWHLISNNTFANIKNPINIVVAPGAYSYTNYVGTGILATQMNIQNNYIGSQTTTAAGLSGQFVNQAISLSNPSGNVFVTAGSAFAITSNTVDRVFRGMDINSFSKTNFPVNTSTNNIKLVTDNIFNASQRAINYASNQAGSIKTNTFIGSGSANTLSSLFYAGNSTNNPTVACNTASNSYVDFEFNSSNSLLTWGGNTMVVSGRGMVLSNNGIIGNQGSSTYPHDNVWSGTWTGGNNGTYVDGSSNAASSKLYVKSTAGYAPPNPGWFNIGQSYGIATNTPNATGSFTGCGGGGGGGGGGGAAIAQSSQLNLTSANSNTLGEELNYISNFAIYENAKTNNSLNSTQAQSFVNNYINSSIDKFYKIDLAYGVGNNSFAKALNASITHTNLVEYNYKAYYNLYDKFVNTIFSEADNDALFYLANQCPGNNGAVVYKARALYNFINKTVGLYNDNCANVSSSREGVAQELGIVKINEVQIDLFPNPAENFVTLYSGQGDGPLNVIITDVGGKIIQSTQVITKDHMANIDLKLQNGVYFVTIINSSDAKVVKKLIISK